MTSREIKKFTPYKRILRGSDSSSINAPNSKQVPSGVEEKTSNESLAREMEVAKKQDSQSSSDEMPKKKMKFKNLKKSKSEKRSKTTEKEKTLSNVLIEESSTSGEDKHDKENTTRVDDIIHVEDSNDAADCVIVIDGNGNNVKSSGKSQTVSCSSRERKESSSPGKLNSNPLGSTQVNFSQKVSMLSASFSEICSPNRKHKKKLKKSKHTWDSLVDNANVLEDKTTGQTESQSESTSTPTVPLSQGPNSSSAQFINQDEYSHFKSMTSSSKSSTNINKTSTASTSNSSCSNYQIDLTTSLNSKSPNSCTTKKSPICTGQSQLLNQTNTKTTSQSICNEKIDRISSLLVPSPKKRQKTQCSEDEPLWITLDDTIIPNNDETIIPKNTTIPTNDETIIPGVLYTMNDSDVLILDSTDCETNSQASTNPPADESVIIDLEMIGPTGNKSAMRTNSDPLIVFQGSNQSKPSTSLNPWSNSESYGICNTPDIIPLKTGKRNSVEKLNNRTTKKKRSLSLRTTKKGKRRLSLIESKKLSAIKNIVYDPNQALPSSSGTSSAVWNNFPQQGTPKSNNSFNHVLQKGFHGAPPFGTQQQKGGNSTISSNPGGGNSCVPSRGVHGGNPTTSRAANANSCFPPLSRGVGQQSAFSFMDGGLPKGGRVRGVVPPSNVQQREDTNIYNPGGDSSKEKKKGLRPIIIDGCNVAMEHGKVSDPTSPFNFSGKGVQIVVDYFRKRGHKEIHVFIPHHKVHQRSTSNPEILEQLKTEGILTLTPSRFIEGRLQVSYDDRYIVQTAAELGGVIVSNDRYRDLMLENEKWKATIEQRLLMFNFVKDMLMFPQDPLGRAGPSLDQFLKFPE